MKKSYTVSIDTFENGKIKEKVEIRTKETKEFTLHTYEKHIKRITTRYYESGKIWYRITLETDIGTDVKPCSETYFKQEEFWENGNKKVVLKIECDCKSYYWKEWNKDGKMLNVVKSKIKRFY